MKHFTLLFSFALLLAPVLMMAQGSCNEADLEYMGENLELVQSIATSCGTDCIFGGGDNACVFQCIADQTPLSDACISCFVDQVDCVVSNCFLACAFNPGSANCSNCVESNCLAPFQECAGIVDLDNDTYTNLNDCDDNNPNINPDAAEIWYDGVDQNCDGADDFDQDGDGDRSVLYGGTDCDDLNPNTFNDAFLVYVDADDDGFGDDASAAFACVLEAGFSLSGGDCNDANSTIYPGAIGTGLNQDNDCNGIVEEDEVAVDCSGDFNGDLVINSADLLALLSEFGCTSNCDIDLNGDDELNTSDLLSFLSVFGGVCTAD